MKKFLKDDSGFTLVELMVVVAIISILSTIAIPNFKKFQAKAKTSEAKLHLSSIYSAEVAFLSDADVYATCLKDMGYDPSSQASQRYFTTGFGAGVSETDPGLYPDDDASVGRINGVPCTSAVSDGMSGFIAGKKTGGQDPIEFDALQGTQVNAEGSIFEAAAQGWISPSFIKEKNAFLSPILDSIIGQAYAVASEDGREAAAADGYTCDATTTAGSSLFTIDEDKSLLAICNGY